MTENKKGKKSPNSSGEKSGIDKVKKAVNSTGLKLDDKLQFTQFSINRATDSIFWIGSDARILFVNETACKRLGYTQKELLAMKVTDFDPNFTAEIWPKHWEEIQKKGSFTVESIHQSKEGVKIPVEVNVNYLVFNDKEYNIAYSRPIEERKLAEEALLENETKFRMLSEQGLLAMVIIQDNIVKYANQATADIVEMTIEEILNLKPYEFGQFIHPDDREFAMAQSQKKQAGQDDVVNNYSFRLITKTGKLKWIDQYSKSVIYNKGTADFVSMVDITERKQAEELLQKAHDELEFLVNERTVELTEANRQLKRRIFDLYTIFELSRNFNAVLNYETLLDSFVLTSMGQMGTAKAALYLPRRVGGKHFHRTRVKGAQPFPKEEILIDPKGKLGDFVTAFNRPVFIEDVINKLADTEDISFVEHFRNGLIVPLIFQTKLRGILIISEKESGINFQDEDIEFLSILANQTAVSIENARLYDSEKDSLEKLQKTQKLLLQSERLAVLGELSAKVAHEVNNPLGIIKNYLQLMDRQIDENKKAHEYLTVVRQEINRIALIVKQLLEMSRPVNIKFSKIDPTILLKEVIMLMARRLKDVNIEIFLEIQDKLPMISVWPDGLKQVLINMIINARDAIDSDGQVTIKTELTEHTIRIIIADNGPGVDPKHIPYIFEPFFSTKEPSSGTGLGLSVCNSIIKNHNGTIEYCPEKKGGCFKIELPIEQEESEYEYRI